MPFGDWKPASLGEGRREGVFGLEANQRPQLFLQEPPACPARTLPEGISLGQWRWPLIRTKELGQHAETL